MTDTAPPVSKLFSREAARVAEALGADPAEGVPVKALASALRRAGLAEDDPRTRALRAAMRTAGPGGRLALPALTEAMSAAPPLVRRAAERTLIIPDFATFCVEIGALFEAAREVRTGTVADYIPELAHADPEHYGLSVCTVDGQTAEFGDTDIPFTIQSVCKPFLFCSVLEQFGLDRVHARVGREASGDRFNAITLNEFGVPHNPMINAGAIACASLLSPERTPAERFEQVRASVEAMAGGLPVGLDEAVYRSETETGDRNYALGYFLRENGVIPADMDVREVLDVYFRCCSMAVTTRTLAAAAASMANGGNCPFTGERVLSNRTIKNGLSMMFVNGLYDYSGEFAFHVGLPAKSGVSGIILVVVPKTLGLAIWSPRIDAKGNSARGLDFCKRLIARFNFHQFDAVDEFSGKVDPRYRGRR